MVKQKLCYVALNFRDELSKVNKSADTFLQTFELPDGRTIMVDTERFSATELLFDPSINGKNIILLMTDKKITQTIVKILFK